MNKGSSIVALSALLAVASASASNGEIVAIYKSGTQQYFIDQGNGFKDAAQSLGYSAKIINVELDANLAINAVTDAIASGAKAIAITAPDQALGPAVARAAKEAGIPVIATDDPLKDGDGNPIPFAGFDGKAMGTKVGQRAGKLLRESGWLEKNDYGVLSVEVQTVSVCNDRTDASREQVIAAGADASKIYPVAYSGTTDSSLTATGPVITSHPNINKWVVFACNDEGVLGATNALKNAGFPAKDVIAVGLGAYEACRPWKANIPSGFKAALYISGVDVGEAAARALIKSIESGQPLPLKTVANTTIVDASNYQTFMPCN
ncbi:arabinose ABC transporter substrate-binding protein [Vibrio nigripulchritudo]|uniref:arabinose ABC transporter substrate-binding protein n=1 Tax=Vibrio nigripulchritudo TaxID=28173 RepID=UPI0024935471|nr:arabinose ABC transporter substrate-binding protein [Vibrio nigripulchritudo]BDU37140.1 sugar ABC transporter substrate-binding protein [Vibrio nigripulchritudo]BDU42852.1 sugar ABC transporter substrate-binding protein [Vibrio nigripulchritudo]